MKAKMNSSDPDIRASFASLKRAAKAARKLAETTGTPFYVMRGARIVNLNPKRKKQPTKR